MGAVPRRGDFADAECNRYDPANDGRGDNPQPSGANHNNRFMILSPDRGLWYNNENVNVHRIKDGTA